MKKGSNLSVLTTGILKENPALVLILGTCPTLAVTETVTGAVGMGLAALVVLVCSKLSALAFSTDMATAFLLVQKDFLRLKE